mmetsp:Transcript_17710/g.37641  ORF Transcript_17710/g.37641 Transcript_17710/m.37641 type:complete len:361 (+) Transcript_17710:593-1675(+)
MGDAVTDGACEGEARHIAVLEVEPVDLVVHQPAHLATRCLDAVELRLHGKDVVLCERYRYKVEVLGVGLGIRRAQYSTAITDVGYPKDFVIRKDHCARGTRKVQVQLHGGYLVHAVEGLAKSRGRVTIGQCVALEDGVGHQLCHSLDELFTDPLFAMAIDDPQECVLAATGHKVLLLDELTLVIIREAAADPQAMSIAQRLGQVRLRMAGAVLLNEIPDTRRHLLQKLRKILAQVGSINKLVEVFHLEVAEREPVHVQSNPGHLADVELVAGHLLKPSVGLCAHDLLQNVLLLGDGRLFMGRSERPHLRRLLGSGDWLHAYGGCLRAYRRQLLQPSIRIHGVEVAGAVGAAPVPFRGHIG